MPAPDAGGAPAVELRGLARAYGERVALRDVTLSLAAGATLAVLGPNGAGKSTLGRVLATLLRPHAGDVRVLGHPLPRDGWAVRGRIGLLAHEPLLYRDLSVRENLLLHARLHGVARARIAEVLEAVDLAPRAEDPVHALSRGLVQRAAICRAVLHDPDLLVLDEPASGLDPAARALAARLIGPRPGRTRVLITHEIDAALADADHVLVLRAGAPVLVAPAGAVAAADVRRLLEAA